MSEERAQEESRTPARFGTYAVGALILAWVLVPAVYAVTHELNLPLLVHLPLSGLLLAGLAAAAMGAGAFWVEHQLSRGRRI